jgi:ketosteroid isomerase-like protein
MTDEEKIRRAVDEFIEAYRAGDLDRAGAIFTDDLVDMSAGGPTRKGEAAREHFLSRVAKVHEKFKPSLAINIAEIFVIGDMAYQRGDFLVTRESKTGGALSYLRQRYLEVWRRDANANWKICIFMDNSAEPAGMAMTVGS